MLLLRLFLFTTASPTKCKSVCCPQDSTAARSSALREETQRRSPAINSAYLNGKIQFVIENIFVLSRKSVKSVKSGVCSIRGAGKFKFRDGHLLLDTSNGLRQSFWLLFGRKEAVGLPGCKLVAKVRQSL